MKKKILPAILFVLLSVSCGTTAATLPASDPAGENMVHEPSGLIIPMVSGIWHFDRLQKFTDDGYDMGYDFLPADKDQGMATLYIYPAGSGLSEEVWTEHYQACRDAMLDRYINHEILEESQTYPEASVLIRYRANGQNFYSLLYLTFVKGWYLKYRIIVDESAWTDLEEDVFGLLSNKYLPVNPLPENY